MNRAGRFAADSSQVRQAPKPAKAEPNRFDLGANPVALGGSGKRGQARAHRVSHDF